MGRIKEERSWRIIGVYVKDNMREMLQELERRVGEKERQVETIIVEDFNARTGEERARVGIEGKEAGRSRKEESKSRRSKNKKINNKRKMLVEFLEKRGWGILNERTKENEEKEYTFVGGRESAVIDYVIADKGIKDKVGRLEIRDKIDSDHQLVEVWMKGEKWRREKKLKVVGEYGVRKEVRHS